MLGALMQQGDLFLTPAGDHELGRHLVPVVGCAGCIAAARKADPPAAPAKALRLSMKRTTWWTCSACGTTTGSLSIETTEETAKSHAMLNRHITRTSSGKTFGMEV